MARDDMAVADSHACEQTSVARSARVSSHATQGNP